MVHDVNEEKCFEVLWTIENIDCWKEMYKYSGLIDCIPFEVEGCKYILRYEEVNENAIAVHLTRNETPAKFMEVKFEIAFIGDDGSVLVSKQSELDSSACNGSVLFENWKEIYDTKRSLLPEDTLKVCCRMWKKGESIAVKKCLRNWLAFSKIDAERSSFLWSLGEFNSLTPGEKCEYIIKSPKNDEPIMSIKLYVHEGEPEPIFELHQINNSIRFATFKLFLVDASGYKIECNRENFQLRFKEERECAKFTLSFTRKQLLANKRMFLPKGVLSLHWECAFSVGQICKFLYPGEGKREYGYKRYTSQEIEFSDTHDVNKEFSSNPLLGSLKYFYDEKVLCDTHLSTFSRSFHAHKVVLAASSSVFKTMFERQAKENKSSGILIHGVDDETAKRMLHYMYTSSVGDLTWESATALYHAANKYGILGLKNECLSYLKENLSTSNACEALLWADEQAIGDFKAAVYDYIVKHGKEMGNTEWRPLINSNGNLAAEALYRLFCGKKLKVSQESC